MHLPKHKLCTRKTELALDAKYPLSPSCMAMATNADQRKWRHIRDFRWPGFLSHFRRSSPTVCCDCFGQPWISNRGTAHRTCPCESASRTRHHCLSFAFDWSRSNKALAKRYSQLKPTRAKFTTSLELGIVWPPTWLELARVGLNLIKLKFSPNSSQVFHRLATSANYNQVVLLLLSDYVVVFRQLNGFVASWLDLAVSFGHPPMQVLIL